MWVKHNTDFSVIQHLNIIPIFRLYTPKHNTDFPDKKHSFIYTYNIYNDGFKPLSDFFTNLSTTSFVTVNGNSTFNDISS